MTKTSKKTKTVSGRDAKGMRLTSKIFEEQVREAAALSSKLNLESYGQHNIGMRLGSKDNPIQIRITGPVGQRLGCMGQPGATIVCEGPASDDAGPCLFFWQFPNQLFEIS